MWLVITTLNNLEHLKDVHFGSPYKRPMGDFFRQDADSFPVTFCTNNLNIAEDVQEILKMGNLARSWVGSQILGWYREFNNSKISVLLKFRC